jgi:hypothetical protein
MPTKLKQLTVEVEDDTKTELVEQITVKHLNDLGDGVKAVVEDFVVLNGGAVIPPVSIEVKELEGTDSTGS